MPSIAPEASPPGTYGELLAAEIVGHTTRLDGDPYRRVGHVEILLGGRTRIALHINLTTALAGTQRP